jgi:hypothetical protein
MGDGAPRLGRRARTDGRLAAAAAEARSRGWPVTGGATGDHQDIATSPERVAELLR